MMKKIILICLINVLVIIGYSQSAEARVSVGFSSPALAAEKNPGATAELEQLLSEKAGEQVSLRAFNDEGALSNWLLRFQEIDAAIVSAGFTRQQAAGTLVQLADIHTTGSKTPLALTARHTVSRNLQDDIQKAFLSVSGSQRGKALLKRIGIAGITRPGEKLRVTAPPKPVAAPKTSATTAIQKPSKPSVKTSRVQTETAAQKEAVSVKPTPAAKAVKEPAQKPERTQTATKPLTSRPTREAPAEAPPEPTEEEAAKGLKEDVLLPVEKAVEKVPQGDATVNNESPGDTRATMAPKEVKTQAEKSSGKNRITVFIALLILVAIIIKCVLIVLRWQSKQRPKQEAKSASPVEEPVAEIDTAAIEEPEAEPSGQPLVIEAGNLGPGKVPELLLRCAELPRPVVLQINRNGNEKDIYFAGGQVSGAFTQNSTDISKSRWDKLGNLLVREGLITEDDMNKAVELMSTEPDLRLGEALLKLGSIDLEGLRQALTRQAKVTVYSLILFPEGQYRVIDDASSLPPEESVSLEAKSLIREASHHKSEWTAIRQTLPKLNTKLSFTDQGKEKLANVSLAPQQEQTLALVDGNRTINDLCLESSLLDYEVYRFLYLMVKTGVLK